MADLGGRAEGGDGAESLAVADDSGPESAVAAGPSGIAPETTGTSSWMANEACWDIGLSWVLTEKLGEVR